MRESVFLFGLRAIESARGALKFFRLSLLFFLSSLFLFLPIIPCSKKKMTDADPKKPTEDKAAAATEAEAAAPAPAPADAVATLEGDDLFDEFGKNGGRR